MPYDHVRAALLAVLVTAGVASPVWSQLAARPAEEWIKSLDSPERIASLRLDEVIGKLNLQPGQVVADLGAGSGAFAIPLARAVGPSGKVYAVEIQQGMVDYVAAKAKRENLPNVHAVLGKFTDPALPAADVDVAFLHDVLHHVQDRKAFLKNAVRYLKPTGRVAVVEFEPTLGPHRDDPRLHITRAELGAWMAELGFSEAGEFPLFDDKWYVTYARP